MGETGIRRFPGSLDPRADEFRPRNRNHPYQPTGLNQLCNYEYTSYGQNGRVEATPYCDFAAVGVWYVGPPALVAPPVSHFSSTATRTLLLRYVPGELVSETSLRRELEVFGEVRGVEMEALRDGIVTVHFYDLRHAEMELTEIRNQHMQHQTRLRNHYMYTSLMNVPPPHPPPACGLISGFPVWAQFVVPAQNAVPGGQIFEAFGPVKELRETPLKKNQKFVEFFDIRDAAKALKNRNGKKIHGKPVVIEFSRPGGNGGKFLNAITPINNHHTKSQNHPPPPPFPWPPYPPKFSNRLPPPSSHLSQTKISAGKSNFNKGNINGQVIVSKMASMHLNGAVQNGGLPILRTSNSKKGHCNQSNTVISSTKQQQQQAWSSRPSKKGKQAKKFDTRFLITEAAVVESSSGDSRTTVMIRNIPNKYSQKLLLNMLDNHCIHCNEQIDDVDDQPLSTYDFVYLPIDFKNKCNVGYGFVNMTTPEANLETLQGLPSSTLGGLQLQKNL
ncbi:protein terminal ear1 [Quillaja saponaria]|uniref:Protein terminal ear1 n=1 Tax=Quillaja saponaria TaxID=32244 RepID=A0AAD7LA96_QUISA|nr:protein terminal ear1 [Quillaja saponaria]